MWKLTNEFWEKNGCSVVHLNEIGHRKSVHVELESIFIFKIYITKYYFAVIVLLPQNIITFKNMPYVQYNLYVCDVPPHRTT